MLTAGGAAIRDAAAASAPDRATSPYGPVRPRRTRPRSAISELARDADLVVVAPATANLMAKMAGGHRRRSRLDGAARHRHADPDRAGHERADVAASGDAAQPGDALQADGVRGRRARTTARWLRRVRARPHGRAARDRRGGRARCCAPSGTARRQAGARDLGPDARADRPGALHRQPLLRQAGPRHRAGRGRGRRARDAGLRARSRCPIRRRRRSCMWRRAREMLDAVEAALPADIARVLPPRSPTGASANAGAAEDQEGRRRPAGAARWSRIPTSSPRSRSATQGRPALVVGFAAETENVIEHAQAKLAAQGLRLIVANDVSAGTGVMGGDRNTRASRHRRRASRPGRP